jgi:hypothetical protein
LLSKDMQSVYELINQRATLTGRRVFVLSIYENL